jgi:hypothetical protein
MVDQSFPVNNLLGTAKSREVQRAMLAEMRGEPSSAALHFLAAAHMELVLAADYDTAGEAGLGLRSRVSAASCFWRAGQVDQARILFDSLLKNHPEQATEIGRLRDELAHDYPALAS